MTLSSDDITSIVGALRDSDWDEAVVVIGDVKISVARNGARLDHASAAASAPAIAASAPATAVPAPEGASSVAEVPVAIPAAERAAIAPAEGSGDHVVTAPSVGVFWRAPEPGAAAFVEVGAQVTPDDNVCIVEIMKLMNYVAAGTTGIVTAVHVENGQAVEFGTPLFSISTNEG